MASTTVLVEEQVNPVRGFTKVDNERLEAWTRSFPIKEGLLLLIERMTSGWHRSAWSTTVKELSERLGRRREAVSRALRDLTKAGEVIRDKVDRKIVLSLPPLVITETHGLRNIQTANDIGSGPGAKVLSTPTNRKEAPVQPTAHVTHSRQPLPVNERLEDPSPVCTKDHSEAQEHLPTERDDLVTQQCDRSVTPTTPLVPTTRDFPPSPKEKKKKEKLSRATAASRSTRVDGAADAGKIDQGKGQVRPKLPQHIQDFLVLWQKALGPAAPPEERILHKHSETQLTAALGWLVHRCNNTRVFSPTGLFKTLLKAVGEGEKPIHPFSEIELHHIAQGYHPMLFVPGAKPKQRAYATIRAVETKQVEEPQKARTLVPELPPSPTCLLLDLEEDVRRTFGQPFLREVRSKLVELHQDKDENAPMDLVQELVQALIEACEEESRQPSTALRRAQSIVSNVDEDGAHED